MIESLSSRPAPAMIQFDLQPLWDLYQALWEWFDPPRPLPKPDPDADEKFERLLERNPRFSDPVYRANVQKLIERSRRFEDSKE
jgi:hypothetical protein